MGIYIKDMEMPKDGVYWCEIGVADDIAIITIHGEDRKSFTLVPVPPHGKLIDADAFEKKVLMWLPNDPCGQEEKEFPFETDICVSMLMEIEEAPTVIPADKDGEI